MSAAPFTIIARSGALALMGLCVAGTALAQPAVLDRPLPPGQTKGDWQVDVGVAALNGPDYDGSDDRRTFAVPFINLAYKDIAFFSVQEGLGVNLIRTDDFRAGPVARVRFARDESENEALKGLGDVDLAIEAGGFAEWRKDGWSAKIVALTDVSDAHGGSTARVSVGRSFRLKPVIVSLGADAQFVSKDVNQTYFGVNAAQAARSGYAVYSPKGGLQSAAVSALTVLPLSQNSAVLGLVSYTKLMGDAADSPIVRIKGSEDQVTAGAFYVYRF